jgi:hypothetical protein
MQLLATRSIDLGRSLAFAGLSGDFNPLHCDPVLARRTMFRGSVVHGVHAMLLGLDALSAARPHQARAIRRLNAQFQKPISTSAPFSIALAEETQDTLRLELAVEGRVAQTIRMELGPASANDEVNLDAALQPHAQPRDITFAEAASASGILALGFARELYSQEVPALASVGLDRLVAVILAATRIVGMECPGQNSVFSGLTIGADPGAGGESRLRYSVVSAAERLSTIKIGIEGLGISGMISALYRPPPVRQASYADIKARVARDAFRDQSAIIVGGSRGLGEIAAKILAAGGASVWLTYHAGRDDAAALCHEIISGGGSAAAGHLDIALGEFDNPNLASGAPPSHIYLFASPPILAKRSPDWDQDAFERYARAYARDAIAIVEALAERTGARLDALSIFIPSSVFVDSPPVAFAEYAAAKAAAEIAWRALAKVHPGLKVEMPRLPRMLTDQTNSLTGTAPLRAEDVLLPLLLGRTPAPGIPATLSAGFGQ